MLLKDYLSQCALFDRAISSKLELLSELKQKSLNSKSFLENVGSGCVSSMIERTVEKICRLEASINADIDHYVDLKEEVAALINTLPDLQQRVVMEQHYLCNKKWEQISEETFISLRNLMYMHKRALIYLESFYSGSALA